MPRRIVQEAQRMCDRLEDFEDTLSSECTTEQRIGEVPK